jgi:SpoIID/LytB domain protein
MKRDSEQLAQGALTSSPPGRKKVRGCRSFESSKVQRARNHSGRGALIPTPLNVNRVKDKNRLRLLLCRIFLPLLFLFVFGCAEMPVYREEVFYPKIKQPAVTVKLLETDEDIVISPRESFVIRCSPERGEGSVYYASASVRAGVSEHGIFLSEGNKGEIDTDLKGVSFFPQKEDSYLFLNGKPYRGGVEVVLSSENPEGGNAKSMLVLNVVWVEDYLKGVVPAEIGKLSEHEIEALKTQAIAARTYSLSRLGQYQDWGYDLEASVLDQVYSGVDGEDPLVNEAIKQTAGEVIAYQGKLIDAYYHANSGGKTEYVENVWGRQEIPYLVSVDDDEFCSWAKNYSWEEIWDRKDLERNLSAYLDSLRLLSTSGFGRLVDLVIKERSPSGRIEVLDVVSDSRTYRIYKDKIRWALRRGSDPELILPSTLFDLEIERGFGSSITSVTATGRGNGHGVGMCQTGAIGMAREGYSCEDILTHYYPGVNIIRNY